MSAADQTAWRATGNPGGYNYGERLFQAARFVTDDALKIPHHHRVWMSAVSRA